MRRRTAATCQPYLQVGATSERMSGFKSLGSIRAMVGWMLTRGRSFAVRERKDARPRSRRVKRLKIQAREACYSREYRWKRATTIQTITEKSEAQDKEKTIGTGEKMRDSIIALF